MSDHRSIRTPAVPLRRLAIGLLALFAASSRAAAYSSPSVDVLGSYFPAWFISMVAGVALTLISRLLFIAWKLDPHLRPAPIIFPCLMTIFSLTVWLLFFKN